MHNILYSETLHMGSMNFNAIEMRETGRILLLRPHRRQPTRLGHPLDSPGKNTGVGCHFRKVKSEVAQLCPTLPDPMDYSLPGSSIHGIFQARVLEWSAIAFSETGRRHFKFRESWRGRMQFVKCTFKDHDLNLMKICLPLLKINN